MLVPCQLAHPNPMRFEKGMITSKFRKLTVEICNNSNMFERS